MSESREPLYTTRDYLDGQFKTILDAIHALDATVNGNGQPGLKQRVTRIETWGTVGGAVLAVLVVVLAAIDIITTRAPGASTLPLVP